jgi:Domain of unknown function (DUF4411)
LLYLLDADTLIKADGLYYPPARFPVFWDWLRHVGAENRLKVPKEQYEEVTAGKGQLVHWLKDAETRDALLLDEQADPALVAEVTLRGYGVLDEAGLVKVGHDPFLIAYGYAARESRCVVTFKVSAPRKLGANRKIPDVCADLGVECYTLFALIDALDFTTNWKPCGMWTIFSDRGDGAETLGTVRI